jgi:Flp pilus assembly protein CpaB
VTPEESERLTLGATEGKIQLALRNPLDKETPETPGIQPASLLGATKAAARRPAGSSARASRPVATVASAAQPEPTVEIIRGDKRAQEVVR